ncbi:MBL fold metallo-hydrolase RNA specificity domain-containing protein [Sphingobacterium hungaricum]
MSLSPLPDFLVQQNKGYYCRYGDFYLDPLEPVETAVVSHAHADHARPGHRLIYTTATTAVFMQTRYTRQRKESYRAYGFFEHFKLKEVDLYFIPAGHILGSAQIMMIYQGVKYLYTGDFKMQEDSTCEPIEIEQADVLITETTFANPETKHPDPVEEIKKLNTTQINILLGCYTLGKAQRLTALINAHCPDKEVLVHHGILPFHRIYDREGFQQLTYLPYNRQAMKVPDQNKIYLVPPFTFSSYIRAKNVIRAFASGWKRLQHQNGIELLISDHVDWDDLLSFIEQVRPQEIWTIHGDGRHLKDYLSGSIAVKELR